ncbi:hypothetical protein [Flavobacterium tructae]|uniref:Uncharacterized protein n=1 Tax=Flavobacterium tructae TaxID=1114873 RepID=A0A1S1J6S9_9FLAO|nr:hypothetical protein [Flavobacterium tructae]OHT44856.1 hypothetical protein BHE19_09040 [Flavobacterium tructae]OXB14870.1 hypothetical protein B0A71_21245 [Flavobacterium tructae]OXB24808.1 hypothetical protein B0A80_04180 [Flavobacterium tructae]
MFGLFNKQKDEALPEWYSELQQSQERWFNFLEKLEAKLEEFATAAIPELKEILQSDDDLYKRTFHRVYSGVNGQLSNIREKARHTYEEKIIDVYNHYNSQISVLSKHYNLVSNFRNVCSDRHNDFEDQYEYWRKQIEKTQERDLEIEYQKILDEFEAIKNKFNCTQCGGNIEIEKIFLIETYIQCPYCNTQNTFAPSTQARNLQNIARGLAEQRTAHLYEAFEIENNKERELYHQRHELSLSKIHESDKKVLSQILAKMEELEEQRQFVIKNAPKLHQIYLRAMYDEWNKITPDLKEHNEKMYQNQLQYL